jgi:photosystem II stability/assembly factor-like uncharacterized protein
MSNHQLTTRSAIITVSIALLFLITNTAQAGGGQWHSLGPEGGLIQTLAIDPQNPQILYAGTTGGGIFKSTDGGSSWQPINNGLMEDGPPAIQTFAIDPLNPQNLYASKSGELSPPGVFKSTNGGENWSTADTGLPNGIYFSKLLIDPQAPQTLYAVACCYGIYKSTNGGDNWSGLDPGIGNWAISDLVIDPQTPQTLYLLSGAGLYKSFDGGDNWDVVNTDFDLRQASILALDPQIPQTLYAVIIQFVAPDPDTFTSRMLKSTDGGSNWTPIGDSQLNTQINNLALDSQTPQTVYVTTDDGVYKSTTSGSNWSAINDGIPSRPVQALAINPVTPQTLYVGIHVYGLMEGDGRNGVYKSRDGGGSWYATNSGLTNKFISTLTITPETQPILYAGTYGLGLFKSTDGGHNWAFADNGLSKPYIQALVFDPHTPATLYVSTGDGLFKSTNAGSSWEPASTGLPESGYIEALTIDPQVPDILYAANFDYGLMTGQVFKSVNGGSNWNLSNTGLPDNCFVRTIVVSPQTPQTLYVGTSNGRDDGCGIYKSNDGGDNWSPRNSGLPSAADPGLFVRINILAIDPQTPSTVYAGLGSSVNGDEVGLYKTVDAGDTWQRIGNGLPEVPITGLAIDPQSPTTLYASTFDIWSGYGGHGVYQSTDGGNSWYPINVGLANPFVFPLAIDPLLPQKLYAGTFGGGVFGVNQSAVYIYLPVISGN